MDDLNGRLEEILSDPESMKRVRMLAESLLGEESEQSGNGESEQGEAGASDAADISRIISILGRLENRGDDNRTRLLLALRPHLSERRRVKVDSAVKLLKLIEALPLLKEAGILDFG